MSLRIAGKVPVGKHLGEIKKSPNYREGGFQNLSETPMMSDDASYWKMLKDFLKKNNRKVPSFTLPSVTTDLIHSSFPQPFIVWFGHSSYLLRIHNKNFLVDPVFSGNASPVSFLVNAFPGTNMYGVKDMPDIDYLIITHDHYDHLDFKTVVSLKEKVKKIVCPLGVGAHLQYWGYEANQITELDWWGAVELNNKIKITSAPARHFSGRGIKRGQTLWSSFILQTETHNLYLGGDSGYDSHFKEIGNQYGPFDLAILECGQYNSMWPLIHMKPEETVQASVDLKAKIFMPVHWAKFSLAMHPWNESIIRATAKAADLSVDLRMPQIGEPLIIDKEFTGAHWWEV